MLTRFSYSFKSYAVIFLLGWAIVGSPAAVAQEPSQSVVPPQPQVEDRRFPELPFQGEGELFDIPPGFERPIEVDEGELIPVTSFVLSGIESNPDLAEYHDELIAILETERVRMTQINVESQKKARLDDALYNQDSSTSDSDLEESSTDELTDAESAEPSDLGDEPQTLADPTGDQPDVLSDAPPIRSGMTIGQIQQAANLAAEHLREKGFFLAQGVLPEQTVVNGTINILFLPGILGDIRVENNRWYAKNQLTDLYDDLRRRPVERKSLERSILGMQDLPGLKSYASLVRGTSVGTTDLLIRTQEENRHEFALSFNNDNLNDTGLYQLQLDYSLNNALGVSDVLSLGIRSTLSPANNQFISLAYDLPVSHVSSFFFNLYTVEYTIDATAVQPFDTEGSTFNFTTRFEWQIVRSRYYNLFLSIAFDLTDLTTSAGAAIDQSSRITSLSLSLSTDWVEVGGNSLNTLDFIYSVGLPDFLNSDTADIPIFERLAGNPGFSYYRISYQRLQSINNNNSILFKLRYQDSGDELYSIHRASIGGADSFRGLPSSSLLRETSASATVEYILAAPFFSTKAFNDTLTWGQVFQISFFYDHVIAMRGASELGSISTPEDPDAASLSSFGLSVQFNVPELIKVRLDYAFLTRNSATQVADGSTLIDEYVFGTSAQSQATSQIYFLVEYLF